MATAMQDAVLSTFDPQEPVELTQQLIRIPSFLWRESEVGFWIADPENGQLNIRSEINLAILRSLREHRIEIPYPQRVVHMIPPSH